MSPPNQNSPQEFLTKSRENNVSKFLIMEEYSVKFQTLTLKKSFLANFILMKVFSESKKVNQN